MNDFVNYQKRSVQLPEGCKDLIDVLGLSQAPWLTSKGTNLISPRTTTSEWGKLGEIESRIARLVSEPDKSQLLTFTILESPVVAVTLQFIKMALAVALVHHGADTVHEETVRRIFEDAGIVPNMDFVVDIGSSQGLVLRYPLPSDLSSAASLVENMLRNGCGVTDEAQFYCYHFKQAAS